jgi:lysophospholipase L1-like esterase
MMGGFVRPMPASQWSAPAPPAAAQERMRHPKPLRRLALLAAALLVALGAGEWFLRRADAAAPSPFAPGADGRVRPSDAWARLAPFDTTLAPARPRVVWLGASTVAGVPYGDLVSPPAWLEAILAARGLDVEVVPLSTSALTSADLERLLPHALELAPTALVVTTGHNEYHDLSPRAGAPWWWRSRLLVRARGLLGLATSPRASLPQHERELDRDALAARFRARLLSMQAASEAAGVPLFLTTPVSNLLDIPPVLGRDDEAPEDADAARARGLAALEAGDVEGARAALVAARDRDLYPHRATTPLIEVVRQVAHRLVPVDRAFEAAAPHGLPGFELFADYCHPNLQGQRLLALVVADALQASGVLPETGRLGEAPPLDEGLARFGMDAEAVAQTQARLARSYVGMDLLRGRPGRLTAIARGILDELSAGGAQGALRGHVEASLALAALLEGDAAAADAHLAAAREASPEALDDLSRLRERYPWVAAAFARAGR